TASAGAGEHCGSATIQQQLGGSFTNHYAYTNLGQFWQGVLPKTSTSEQYLYCDSTHPHQVTGFAPTANTPTCAAPGTKDYAASYDAWGNMTNRSYNGMTATLTYDALDHLTQWADSASSKHEWYFYNATGERVLKRTNDG